LGYYYNQTRKQVDFWRTAYGEATEQQATICCHRFVNKNLLNGWQGMKEKKKMKGKKEGKKEVRK
jgi:hypothetical protein